MASHTIVEKIDYLTQIHTSWDNTEQRMGLRENPRRTLSYRYTGIEEWHSSWMRAITYCKQGQMVEFPVWHAETELLKDVHISETRFQIKQEDIWGFRDCHAVMLWINDETGGRVFDIKEITSAGLIRLKRSITKDYDKMKTRVVPVCYAYVLQESDYTNEHVTCADMVINAEIVPTSYTVDLPYSMSADNYKRLTFDIAKNADETYNGLELFVYPPQWTDGYSVEYGINADRLDNNTGTFMYSFKSTSPLASRTLGYVARTKEELHFLERFFYRVKGQLHSFYCPTWTSDLEITDNLLSGEKELFVKLTIYFKYYTGISRRKTICVFYKDDTIEILKISGFSYSDDKTKGKVFLVDNISHNIMVSDVRMISFLVCSRLTSDEMSINHETNSNAVIEFQMAEVDA